MEVHAHTHTERKKFKHYLWEFLMLFLAVFCGFLAENQREHLVDHQREKQYIRSLLQDLKQDTVAYADNIKSRERRKICADSLIYELSVPVSGETLNSIYYNAGNVGTLQLFNYSNSTIQQLKSSGLMRLIRNSKVVNSINGYDLNLTRHKLREEHELSLTLEFNKAVSTVLDPTSVETIADSLVNKAFKQRLDSSSFIKPVYRPLLTKDADKINLVKGLAAQLYMRNLANYLWVIQFRKMAIHIMELIKKEYHIE